MKRNKHLEFLKRIRLLSEEADNRSCEKALQSNQIHKMKKQEEYDLQRELERRFNELFGTASEDQKFQKVFTLIPSDDRAETVYVVRIMYGGCDVYKQLSQTKDVSEG